MAVDAAPILKEWDKIFNVHTFNGVSQVEKNEFSLDLVRNVPSANWNKGPEHGRQCDKNLCIVSTAQISLCGEAMTKICSWQKGSTLDILIQTNRKFLSSKVMSVSRNV